MTKHILYKDTTVPLIKSYVTTFLYKCDLCGRKERTYYFPPSWYHGEEYEFEYCDDCKKEVEKLKTILRPCPCCAREVIVSYHGESRKPYRIFCSGCGLEMNGYTKEDMIFSWNRRKGKWKKIKEGKANAENG